jgi:hypothetical protein
VKTAHRGDEIGAAGMQACKLERGLDRFGARIAQVGMGQAGRGDLHQFFEQPRANVVVHDVGAGNQGCRLLLDRCNQLRV